MPPNDLRYAREWLAFAEKDLVRTRRALRAKDDELAGFCLQQSIEKFLKALLLSKGWKLVRTYNLVALLDEATTHESSLSRFCLLCQDVSPYYLEHSIILIHATRRHSPDTGPSRMFAIRYAMHES